MPPPAFADRDVPSRACGSNSPALRPVGPSMGGETLGISRTPTLARERGSARPSLECFIRMSAPPRNTRSSVGGRWGKKHAGSLRCPKVR